MNEPGNDNDPQHIFFIGLAYLGGIDVEVNYALAVQLITRSAEAGLPEAMEKLVSMYRASEGVERDFRAAIRWQEKLADTRRAAYEADPTEGGGLLWFYALWGLGDFWDELQQLDQAGEAYQNMLEAARTLDTAYHADWTRKNLADSYDKLGHICKARGDLAGAKAFYEKGYAISERLAAKTDTVLARRDLSVGYNKLGDICRKQGDLAGAKDFYEKSLVIREWLAAETDTVETQRDLIVACYQLGDICRLQGDLEEAMAYYNRGYDVFERIAPEVSTADEFEILAVYCYNMAMVSPIGEGRQKFLHIAESIWSRLARQCPDVSAYKERLALVRQHIQ